MKLPPPILNDEQRQELFQRLGGLPSELGERMFVRIKKKGSLYPFCGVGTFWHGEAPLHEDFRELPPEQVNLYFFELQFINLRKRNDNAC